MCEKHVFDDTYSLEGYIFSEAQNDNFSFGQTLKKKVCLF